MKHVLRNALKKAWENAGMPGRIAVAPYIRRAMLAAAAASAALMLTACHGERAARSFVMPESFDTSREYEITFWAKNETNKNQTLVYEKAVRDFETLYPNIRINIKMYSDYTRIYNDVITNISTGTTPNVCITYPDHIATYLTGEGTVAALDELMSDPRYGFAGTELAYEAPRRDEMIEEYMQECYFSEHYYAVPFVRSTEICYVNADMVEKLGYELPEVLTWDFVWEVSEAAMKKNDDGTFALTGQKVLIPFIYKSTDNMMITMLEQLGAPYSDDAGDILIFNDGTKRILETVREHAATRAFSTFAISGYPANFLNAGQCIFAVDSSAGSTWMGSGAPLSDIAEEKKVSFETAVMTVPQYDISDQKMISQGPSICIFNKDDPQEVLASWLFAQYMLSDEVQIAYAQTEGYVPVTSRARESGSYREYLDSAGADGAEHYDIKIKATQLLLEHTADTFVTPVFNGSASLRQAAGEMIEDITKSVRRKKTVDDAYIDQLYADMTSLYRLDQVDAGGSADRESFGPLPAASRALLVGLGAAWVCIIAFALHKKRQNA